MLSVLVIIRTRVRFLAHIRVRTRIIRYASKDIYPPWRPGHLNALVPSATGRKGGEAVQLGCLSYMRFFCVRACVCMCVCVCVCVCFVCVCMCVCDEINAAVSFNLKSSFARRFSHARSFAHVSTPLSTRTNSCVSVGRTEVGHEGPAQMEGEGCKSALNLGCS